MILCPNGSVFRGRLLERQRAVDQVMDSARASQAPAQWDNAEPGAAPPGDRHVSPTAVGDDVWFLIGPFMLHMARSTKATLRGGGPGLP